MSNSNKIFNNSALAAEIVTRNGKSFLRIGVPLEADPAPSKSGKSLVCGSTKGNVTTSLEVDGKPLTVGVNAYVPNR